MKKLSSTFSFSTPYTDAAGKEQQATVKLSINYENKVFAVTPPYGDEKFSFRYTSHHNQRWMGVLDAIKKAIEFANKELVQAEEVAAVSPEARAVAADAPKPDKEKEMEEFINSICAKLTIKTLPQYPDSDFYMDGDLLMLEHNKKTADLWVRWDKIWSVFCDRFGLNYDETQAVTKTLFEKFLKLNGTKPLMMEEELKLEGITTKTSSFCSEFMLEKFLKLNGNEVQKRGRVNRLGNNETNKEPAMADMPEADTKEKEMEEFINSICAKLTIKTLPQYPDSDFYMDGDKWILEHNKKTADLWVRGDKIWSVISDRYWLDYAKTQAVMKNLLEQALKLKGTTTLLFPEGRTKLEEALKLEGITSYWQMPRPRPTLEKALKLKGNEVQKQGRVKRLKKNTSPKTKNKNKMDSLPENPGAADYSAINDEAVIERDYQQIVDSQDTSPIEEPVIIHPSFEQPQKKDTGINKFIKKLIR